MWAPVLELLAGQRELIIPDMPGFGASAPLAGPGEPDPGALAAAIAEFADGLGLPSRPHVAGNSLGGWVALEMAVIGAVESVTALSPAGLWSRPLEPRSSRGHRVARRIRPVLPLLLRSARVRRGALAAGVSDPAALTPAQAYSLVGSYASGTDFVAVNNAMRANTFDGWDRIDVPVTVAWGDGDRLNPPPRRGCPDWVRMEMIPGARHLPMWDAPEAVASLILQTGTHL